MAKKKLHWQTALDSAKEEVDNNPHSAEPEEFENPDLFVANHQKHLVKKAVRGWNLSLSITQIQHIKQWHFSGILDPVGRPFDVSDMNFLVEAAHYLGANMKEAKIVFSDPDQPIYFSWVDKSTLEET